MDDSSREMFMPDAVDADDEAAPRAGGSEKPDLGIVMDIPVTMQVVLGSAVMPVGELLKLGRGAVVKLATKVGEPVDLVVNGRVVARGEIVVLEQDDQRFGITLTEVVAPGAKGRARHGAA